MIETDVCILGAGPGGVAAALKLDALGIPCYLIDKATFPRDKVCGDAISGKVTWGFNRIDPTIVKDFRKASEIQVNCWGIKFVFPARREILVTMPANLDELDIKTTKAHGFVSRRVDFDNFLIEKVKAKPGIHFKEGTKIGEIEKEKGGFIIKDDKGELTIRAKLIIAADGAHSKFAKKYGGIKVEPAHYAAAVRAYYKNVAGFSEFNFIELHYVKEFFPGYLWIFPLPGGYANVGAGMRSDRVSKQRCNLKKDMVRILAEHPRFKDRFKNAELEGDIKGFGLPLGSKKRKISGDNYMLVGDAASLIDPLTGEGIANAVISGGFAGAQAAKCLEAGDFSAEFMKNYDQTVYKQLWQELRISHQIQKTFKYPWLVTLVAKIATSNKNFTKLITSMFTDVEMRKLLRNPLFYFRLLFNR